MERAMAGKKVKNEVEGIRNELLSLSEAVWALREHVTVQSAATAVGAHARKSSSGQVDEIAADLNPDRDSRGTVVTRGVVRDANGEREYRWELEAHADDLLGFNDELASRLLAAIGHRQRLAILKAILTTPTTAADLVTQLDLGTTGAAYHHLKVLQSADLVTTESRGVFTVQPHRVSAIFSILAGIDSASTICFTETPVVDGDTSLDVVDADIKRKKRKAA
jgi:DNA-binding transcriptional ArsR family regulator